jgi:hypothetical protein
MNAFSLTGPRRRSHTSVRMMGVASSIWYLRRRYRVRMASTPPSLTGGHRLRRLGNLVNLSTPLGLAVAKAGRAEVRPAARGLLVADGYRLPFPIAEAFTIGNVLITSGRWDELEHSRPGLLVHEEAHTWQWFWWAGLPFLPAYGVSLVWSVLRTGNRAAANVFERRAGLDLGGYPDVPRRPLLRALLTRRRNRPRRSGRPRSRS